MTYKVLNLYGKAMMEGETFKEACDKGMILNEDFIIKEGTRKAEIMGITVRSWHKWWNSPKRKIINTGDGFRLV